MTSDDDDKPIDFAALDPSRDAARWEALVQRTVERAAPPPPGVWARVGQLRLSLVLAAVAAVVAWVPALRAPAEAPAQPTQVERAASDPALTLAQWAYQGAVGDVTTMLEVRDGQ